MFTDSVFINYFSYYEEMSFLPSYMTLIDAKGKSLLYYYQVALAFNKKTKKKSFILILKEVPFTL